MDKDCCFEAIYPKPLHRYNEGKINDTVCQNTLEGNYLFYIYRYMYIVFHYFDICYNYFMICYTVRPLGQAQCKLEFI